MLLLDILSKHQDDKNLVLRKDDEYIYFEKDLVIKYFNDNNVVSKRLKRAKLLKGYVPDICMSSNNFYAYKKIQGKTLSQVVDNNLFHDMLEYYNNNLWKVKKINSTETTKFKDACLQFYKSKTEMRIASFDAPFSENNFADVSIVIFPGEAGGIKQNINRWRKQINLDNSILKDILNESSEYENTLGPFRIFKLLNNATDEGILGAIINYNNQSIFIKVKTSSIGINELEYEFILFCKSLYWVD